MAMGGWKLIVEVCLPIPFVLIILLTIPSPRVFHRGVMSVVDKTLGLTFVGTLSLLHIMLIVTGVSFLASIKTTSDLLAAKPVEADASPNVIAGHLGKRWRAERNFWISFICFTLWCLLARFYQIMKAHAKVEDELRTYKIRGSDAMPTIPTKPEGAQPKKPIVVEPKKAI
jgi:hypothetical protein